MAEKKRVGILAMLGGMGKEPEPKKEDEFGTAAKELLKAIRGGSEEEFSSCLKSCLEIHSGSEEPEDGNV
jgi:hypothetical protein